WRPLGGLSPVTGTHRPRGDDRRNYPGNDGTRRHCRPELVGSEDVGPTPGVEFRADIWRPRHYMTSVATESQLPQKRVLGRERFLSLCPDSLTLRRVAAGVRVLLVLRVARDRGIHVLSGPLASVVGRAPARRVCLRVQSVCLQRIASPLFTLVLRATCRSAP